MRGVVLAIAAGTCQPSTQLAELPWLHGLSGGVASDRAPRSATRVLDAADLDPGCGADAYREVELIADVAPTPGRETIVASYARGIFVFDREHQLVASAPGYPCEGTADAIAVVAAGHAHGARTIVIAATSGGRTEHDTWLGLFRIGAGRRLEPAFAADVEQHRGETIRYGAVALLPGALVYLAPAGGAALYTYDPVARAYLVPRELLDDAPHEVAAASPRRARQLPVER